MTLITKFKIYTQNKTGLLCSINTAVLHYRHFSYYVFLRFSRVLWTTDEFYYNSKINREHWPGLIHTLWENHTQFRAIIRYFLGLGSLRDPSFFGRLFCPANTYRLAHWRSGCCLLLGIALLGPLL